MDWPAQIRKNGLRQSSAVDAAMMPEGNAMNLHLSSVISKNQMAVMPGFS
jgi:hypothetical protein